MNDKIGLIRETFATMQDWYGLHNNADDIRNGISLIWYVPFIPILCTLPIALLFGHRRNCKCRKSID